MATKKKAAAPAKKKAAPRKRKPAAKATAPAVPQTLDVHKKQLYYNGSQLVAVNPRDAKTIKRLKRDRFRRVAPWFANQVK